MEQVFCLNLSGGGGIGEARTRFAIQCADAEPIAPPPMMTIGPGAAAAEERLRRVVVRARAGRSSAVAMAGVGLPWAGLAAEPWRTLRAARAWRNGAGGTRGPVARAGSVRAFWAAIRDF